MEKPVLDNLWNYLSHFYEKIDPGKKDEFLFEDLAGIYTENGLQRLFALCIRHSDIEGIRTLPEGRYLCASCKENSREETIRHLIHIAETEYGTAPSFTIQLIVVTGILQWDYEVQIYAGKSQDAGIEYSPSE